MLALRLMDTLMVKLCEKTGVDDWLIRLLLSDFPCPLCGRRGYSGGLPHRTSISPRYSDHDRGADCCGTM